jgi:multimeric flavodoxin WrbA
MIYQKVPLGEHMNIIALMASPRKGGNTDILINEIRKGAEGHRYEQLDLYDLNISPCTDCRDCRTGACSIDDDMQDIYPKIEGADVIIFGTPLYWYGPSGPMKLFMDRLLPYSETGKLKSKRAVLVIPSAEGPAACEAVVRMFRLSLDYLGMDIAHILLPTAYDKGEISNNPKTLEQAREIGASL